MQIKTKFRVGEMVSHYMFGENKDGSDNFSKIEEIGIDRAEDIVYLFQLSPMTSVWIRENELEIYDGIKTQKK